MERDAIDTLIFEVGATVRELDRAARVVNEIGNIGYAEDLQDRARVLDSAAHAAVHEIRQLQASLDTAINDLTPRVAKLEGLTEAEKRALWKEDARIWQLAEASLPEDLKDWAKRNKIANMGDLLWTTAFKQGWKAAEDHGADHAQDFLNWFKLTHEADCNRFYAEWLQTYDWGDSARKEDDNADDSV